MRVLLVEDDSATAKSIELMLKSEGYVIDTTGLGEDGLEIGKLYDYDIIVLDLMLPDMDGYEVLRRLRAARVKTPILILSGLTEMDNKLKGLGFGADDYLTKPFSPRTMLARVKSLLRRSGIEAGDTLAAGDLRLDQESHALSIAGGAPLKLTRLETRLLQILLAHAGHVVSTERLLTHVWGHRGSGDRQLLKQLVHRLRQKLERDAAGRKLLQTEAGVGYRLKA